MLDNMIDIAIVPANTVIIRQGDQVSNVSHFKGRLNSVNEKRELHDTVCDISVLFEIILFTKDNNVNSSFYRSVKSLRHGPCRVRTISAPRRNPTKSALT